MAVCRSCALLRKQRCGVCAGEPALQFRGDDNTSAEAATRDMLRRAASRRVCSDAPAVSSPSAPLSDEQDGADSDPPQPASAAFHVPSSLSKGSFSGFTSPSAGFRLSNSVSHQYLLYGGKIDVPSGRAILRRYVSRVNPLQQRLHDACCQRLRIKNVVESAEFDFHSSSFE